MDSEDAAIASKCSVCKDEGDCPLPNSKCDPSHIGPECSLSLAVVGCRNANCTGMCMVFSSKTRRRYGMKLVSCTRRGCGFWDLLDPSQQDYSEFPDQSTFLDCFRCGDPSHISRDCPLSLYLVGCREANCSGVCRVFRSKHPRSYGKKILRCNRTGCGFLDWLEESSLPKVDLGEAIKGLDGLHL